MSTKSTSLCWSWSSGSCKHCKNIDQMYNIENKQMVYCPHSHSPSGKWKNEKMTPDLTQYAGFPLTLSPFVVMEKLTTEVKNWAQLQWHGQFWWQCHHHDYACFFQASKYTHTCTHTHTHTLTHACMNAQTHTCPHACTHTHMWMHTQHVKQNICISWIHCHIQVSGINTMQYSRYCGGK